MSTPRPAPAPTHPVWPVTTAPVRTARIRLGHRVVRLHLHLEGTNRYGSVKDRTAEALLRALEERGRLRPGGHVVESTSGNLGIALAGLCAERGYRCTLAVDNSTPAFSLTRIAGYGAELIRVTAFAGHGVSARLDAVRSFLDTHPAAVWTDQYHSPAGPAMHAATTGPALLRPSGRPSPHAILIPVSTGGVLAGVATHVRATAPDVQIWAVDAHGSAAAGGIAAARPDKLPGFGSALRSSYLIAGHLDRVAYVSDADGAVACRIVQGRTGLSLGGSAGAAVLAAVRAALADPRLSDIACLCPDGGDRYQGLIYHGGPADRPVGADQIRLSTIEIDREAG